MVLILDCYSDIGAHVYVCIFVYLSSVTESLYWYYIVVRSCRVKSVMWFVQSTCFISTAVQNLKYF